MKTLLVDKNDIDIASKFLADGKLVVFPTETVYGLGADAFNEDAIDGIYKAKGRPGDNPLIVHISDMNDVKKLAREVPDFAIELMNKFWPGPMTLIFKKNINVIDRVTAGLDTVAVRLPSNELARELIKKSGVYVAAPSANLSGSPSPTVLKHVIDDLDGRVDCIVKGDECEIGLESTVIDVSGEFPVVLRPGAVTLEMLMEVNPLTVMDKGLVSDDEKPKSPGMKYTHYSPKAQVIVVCGDKENRTEYICNCLNNNSNCGVLTYCGGNYDNADYVIDAGVNMHDYAKSLFYNLRMFDEKNIKTVYAEFDDDTGIGYAVKNRLFKSAGFNVVYV